MQCWKVDCRQCGKSFKRTAKRRNCQQIYCSAECRIRFDRNRTKKRYRNDETFRETMKIENLQRYHAKKQAEGSGAAP